VLCFLAMLASLAAAITTNLQKSHDLPGRISTAEAVDADLEGLQTLLQFHRGRPHKPVGLRTRRAASANMVVACASRNRRQDV
jgi:hypothetical protein